MPDDHLQQEPTAGRRNLKHAAVVGIGIALGGTFLWLSLRDIGRSDVEAALRHVEAKWPMAAVAVQYGFREEGARRSGMKPPTIPG